MGRRKIEIKAIKDDRNRSVTFLKRKGGLFKKAHELSVLCSVDVAVFVFGNNKKLYEYSSADMRDLIAKYQYHNGPNEHKGPSDFNGGLNDDDDDDDGDGTPPRGLNGMDTHMMPPQYQGQQQQQQQQPPPPPPFAQVRHHTASASPPISNGGFHPHPPHGQRGHTPQPPIASRPGSRNDVRQMGRAILHQPVGHPGIPYMATPPIYNHSANPSALMPPGPSYHHPYQPHQHQQHPQQSYIDERRPSAPPSFAAHPHPPPPPPPPPPAPQGVPAGPRAEPPPPPHLSTNSGPHPSPQQERRHLDPHPPPPPVEPKTEASERPKQPFLNTDVAIKKMPQRKTHSIFTPIEENRSILSQHLASFASDSPKIKVEAGTSVAAASTSAPLGPARRSLSAETAPLARNGSMTSPRLQQRSSARTPSVSSLSEATTSTPPAHSNNNLKANVPGGGRARGPRLTVQIPDGGSEMESATRESASPRNPAETPSQVPQQRHNSTTMVLPPPSPSAQNILSAGATGPPNPFARPPPQQSINSETPVSALPSRFLNNELLPSPNSFYPEWNLRGGDSNTLPSPLNFTTPVVGTGPSFLREDATAITMTAVTVSVPTITTTAAPTKRKSPEFEMHDGVEKGEAKRVKVE